MEIFITFKFATTYTEGNVEVSRYWAVPAFSAKLWVRLLNMLSSAFAMFWAVRRVWRFSPQLILVQSPPLLMALVVWFYSKLLGVPLITNFSDIWSEVLKGLGVLRPQSLLLGLVQKIEGFLYGKSALCVGQSAEIIEHIGQVRPRTPTHLYRTGVTLVTLPQTVKTILHKNKFRLVYAGLLGTAQGLFALCKTLNFEDLGVELHLYGDGHERPQIEQLIANGKVPSVFWHGSLPAALMLATLQQYDAVLVYQRSVLVGTVPSKLYEAMAAGLPVLLCGAGEAAQLVNQAQAGLTVAPQQTELLAQTIQLLSRSSPSQLAIWGQNGRAFAQKHFDREPILARFITTLCQIANPKHHETYTKT